MRALEKRPEDRYQSAEEMRHDLEEFLDESGLRSGNRRMALYMQELFAPDAAGVRRRRRTEARRSEELDLDRRAPLAMRIEVALEVPRRSRGARPGCPPPRGSATGPCRTSVPASRRRPRAADGLAAPARVPRRRVAPCSAVSRPGRRPAASRRNDRRRRRNVRAAGWVIIAVLPRDRRRRDGNRDSEMIRSSAVTCRARQANRSSNGMKFVCDRCQTKYSIADERVRGKVLKVKCKTCANVITVREARRASVGGPATLSGGAPGRCGRHRPRSTIGPTRRASPNGRFWRRSVPGPAFVPPRRPTGPTPALGAGPATTAIQWYMALDGARTGPFTRKELVDKLMPLAKNADVHIWNERLDGWKAPTDVPAVAARSAARRKPPPPPPPGRRAVPRRRRRRRSGAATRAADARRPRAAGSHRPEAAAAHGRTSKPTAPPLAASHCVRAASVQRAHARRARRRRSVVAAGDAGAAAAHASGHPGNGQRTNGVGGAGLGRHAPSKAALDPSALRELRRPADAQPAGRAADGPRRGAAPDVGRGDDGLGRRGGGARRADAERSTALRAARRGRRSSSSRSRSRLKKPAEAGGGRQAGRRPSAAPSPRGRRAAAAAVVEPRSSRRRRAGKRRPARRQGQTRWPTGRATPAAAAPAPDARARAGDAARFRDTSRPGSPSRPPRPQPPAALAGRHHARHQQQPRRHQDLLPARAAARQHPHARQDRGEADDRHLRAGQTRRPGRAGAVPRARALHQGGRVALGVPAGLRRIRHRVRLVFQGNE